MVRAANVDMSLDEIISKTKKGRGSIGKKPIGKRAPIRRQSGGPIRRRSDGWRDFDAPENHHIGSGSGNVNKTVHVNISNLAPSVVVTDLDELFADFDIQTSVVNYNEHGESLGTGDITLRKRDADNLIRKFAGVALDGKVMKFALVNISNISGRVDFGARRAIGGKTRGAFGGGRKFEKRGKPEDFLRDGVHEGDIKRGGRGRGRGGPAGRGKRGAGEKKPQKTEAELDAELEAYMAQRKA